MASDYDAIRLDNQRRYGSDIGRVGPMLLADRYADRTHFIFELLQNAEDALARRNGWQGARAVSFELTENALRVSHFGLPFDEPDVRGICGIAESTKDLTAIGRFGIGFKSVYAFTDRPEIHSGAEAFAIESFVWPVATSPIVRVADETVIVVPLKAGDVSGRDEIAHGLGKLGASALLFLRHIDEIRWSVEGGRSGVYLREARQSASGVRRVTVIGQEHALPDVDEEWLIFSRAMKTAGDRPAGHVEIAFSVVPDTQSGRERIRRVDTSPLVVFFPTILETHLGFLVQGPYRTTPSRDNVPRIDRWNQELVTATASLLGEALCWLRDNNLLDAAALRCLPLEPTKFESGSMFAPLYDVTKTALSTESLLPRYDTGYVPAGRARLGRTQELRELFSPRQLKDLYGEQDQPTWISGDITSDRMPELRRYLMQELGVAELTPESVVPRLDRTFLEAQSDEWIGSLYGFLNEQPGLRWRFEGLPLVRLEDGTHVQPRLSGQPQAFLPGQITTELPLVRLNVCASESALAFLKSLGLTQPDPVDDVVRNVLPKYRAGAVEVSDLEYEADVGRIINAFGTDSKGQREKLLSALGDTPFVMALDAGSGGTRLARPEELLLATERLKELFAHVPNVSLVDDRCSCLRGEVIRELLEACGALRHARPVGDLSLSWAERAELRTQAGQARSSGQNDVVTDWTLLGLDGLLGILPQLGPEEQRVRSRLLWEELASLEERRGKGMFTGEYTWTYYGRYHTTFDAAFVRVLNAAAWIPGRNGDLQSPGLIVFDTLGWKPNPFLLSKIRFRPAVIDELAKEAGIEPGVLDLLKRLGVTSEAELRARLGLEDVTTPENEESGDRLKSALEQLLGGAPAPTPAVPDPAGNDPVTAGRGQGGGGRGAEAATGGEPDRGRGERTGGDRKGQSSTAGKRTPGSPGGRPFISYVATHPEGDETDPDGLDQSARMALEAQAIALILNKEAAWHRTPTHNPGFDLYQGEGPTAAKRWCEVKAMSGSLDDRPVGLSSEQFACAREHGSNYWLYVVEHAADATARIVRIQDPAGKARTFTFDHGWLDVAELDSEAEPQKD